MLYVRVVLNDVICAQILYDIVLYAPYLLLVKFFLKCSFNKACFELLQNVTWTDESWAWLPQVQAWMG